MRIALLSGTMSSNLHGRIDVERLFEGRALTGSESSFFNIAWGLQRRGHQVDVYCDCTSPLPNGSDKLAGARVFFHDDELRVRPLEASTRREYDAFISASEPDLLRRAPGGLRIVQQQVNDFAYCKPDFDKYVDVYVFASKVHAQVVGGEAKLDPTKVEFISNSINRDMVKESVLTGSAQNNPHSAIWCSSPDRGLHRLLEIWPRIRIQVPDATLQIFYRFDPWYEGCKDMPNWAGARARYIGACLERLGRNGENGVTVMGPRPNQEMLRHLWAARVLPYTCEPIRFTEGFAVSVMDACAARCVPILSDADALGDIYGGVAHIIQGKPGDHQDEWVGAIVRAMTDDNWAHSMTEKAAEFASGYDREKIAECWEKLILERINKPMSTIDLVARTKEKPMTPGQSIAANPQTGSVAVSEIVDSRAHASRDLSSLLADAAKLGHVEQRTGVFASRGRNYHFRFVCTPSLYCHPSWWSLVDELSVRDTWWHINPGDVVIDAGAAYGSYALSALAMGAARVIAWTPEEHLELAANIHLNNWQDRTDIWNNGLWSETGWLAIWPYAPKPQFFRERPATMPEGATALFPVICMDDALGAGLRAPHRVDWMKMDVEGCEVEVLRGAKSLVREFSPKILVENHLFKDSEIKNKFGELLKQINPAYKEIGTMPYATVSHTLWSI